VQYDPITRLNAALEGRYRVLRHAAVGIMLALSACSVDLTPCILCPTDSVVYPNILRVEGRITVAGAPAAAVVELMFTSPPPGCAGGELRDCDVALTAEAGIHGTQGYEGTYAFVLEDPKDHENAKLVDACRSFAVRATLHDADAPPPWVRDDSAPQISANLTTATGSCRMPTYPNTGTVVHTIDIDFPSPS